MLRLRSVTRGGLLAAVCAVVLHAGAASATLALSQAAALVALPILTSNAIVGQAAASQWSYALVTNSSEQYVTLRLNFIRGSDWVGQGYSCPITSQETVLFTFRPGAGGSSFVDFKCSFAVQTLNGVMIQSMPTTLALPFQAGLLTVALEAPAGVTVSSNLLFADWLVVDFAGGDAYGAAAISFQGLSALSQDGDRNYQFDGREYSTFPAQLAAGFIAPDVGDTIQAELILFTLDATVGGQPVSPGGQVNPVQLRGNVYNDREVPQSIVYSFDGFRVVDVETISPAFTNFGPGGFMSPSGHFDLTPVSTGAGSPAHEFDFGNGDNVRKRPAMGWIVQHFLPGAQLPAVAPPGGAASPPFPAGAGSAARPLGTSTTNFTPLTGETPTLSAN